MLQLHAALNSRCGTPAELKRALLKEVDKSSLKCTRNRGGGTIYGVMMAFLLVGCLIACLAYNGA